MAENQPQPAFEIDLAEQGGRLVFKTPEELRQWNKEEQNKWLWLADAGRPMTEWLANSRNEFFQRLEQQADHWKRYLSSPSEVNQAFTNIKNVFEQYPKKGRLLISTTPAAAFVFELKQKRGDRIARGAYAAVLNAQINTAGSSQSEFFEGIVEAFLFKREIEWTASGHQQELNRLKSDHRKAEVLQIRGANQLFEALWEKVCALGDMAAPHPLSAKMAVATVKRYLVDPAARIRLRDLVVEETEKTVAELNAPTFSAETRLSPAEELNKRLIRYEGLCETLLAIAIAGCYWGNQAHAKLWIDCLERIANSRKRECGLTYLLNLGRYPALLLLYGSGIAAVAGGNYENFASIVTRAIATNDQNEKVSICSVVYPIRVMEDRVGHLLHGLESRHTPISDYLFAKLRTPLREYVPGEEEYQTAFDQFEYLFGLVHADTNRREVQSGWWRPVGCFAWRGRYFGGDRAINTIEAEIDAQGSNWGPLKACLFGGSLEQAKQAKAKFDAFIGILQF